MSEAQKSVLVTRTVEQYCYVLIAKDAGDEEAIDAAKSRGDWHRTMNMPAENYAVVRREGD